jgi:uncharacterized protein (DUF433 family)
LTDIQVIQMKPRLEAALREPRYGIAETSRFVGMGRTRVARWLKGYSYTWDTKRAIKKGRQDPVVKRANGRGESGASFLDLIELLFAKKFVDQGFSLQRVRAALEEARSLLELDYPFASQKFFTDGSEIYLQVREEAPEHLLQLFSGGQWVIPDVIHTFAQQLTFDDVTGRPLDWWPLGKERSVVLNPLVSFGAPSVASHHVKTVNVHDLYVAEGRNPAIVAGWFEIPLHDVRAAVEFEELLLAA